MLTPDMRLGKPLYFKQSLLLKEGTTDLNRFLSSFQKLGIFHLLVEDELCEDIEIPSAISDETRITCKTALFDTFEQFQQKGILQIEQLAAPISSIIDELLENKNIQLCLNDIHATDDNTLVHSVNTTVYSLMLAIQLGYPKNLLHKLAEGTLLHDIGKTSLDKKILFKPGRLSKDEFEYIKSHTILGYDILKNNAELSELSRIVALSHHERLDGSGYPNHLHGNDLHEFIRIAAIADVYEALTADRCYRKSLSPYRASEILVTDSLEKLDANLVGVFMQNIAIYPNGTTVRLSDKHYAIVKEQNPTVPSRPVVKVITRYKNSIIPIYEIDLMKELSLTIIESDVENIK